MIQSRPSDSLLVAHARRELEMAGAFTTTDTFDGTIGRAILATIKVFSEKSGGEQAKMQIIHQSFNSLIAGELLAPPTNDPDEWVKVNRQDGKDVMRNLRSPFYISNDGLKSWHNTATNEIGPCRDHVTGEMLEDPNVKNQKPAKSEATKSKGNDESAQDRSANSSGATPEAGRELDPGVAAEGESDTPKPQSPPAKPTGGEAK